MRKLHREGPDTKRTHKQGPEQIEYSQRRLKFKRTYNNKAQTSKECAHTGLRHPTNLHTQSPDKAGIYTSKAQTNKESTQRAQSTRNLHKKGPDK